ncbi:MAG: hypothetical protein WBQ50_21050, partial [Nocardioides sp.]
TLIAVLMAALMLTVGASAASSAPRPPQRAEAGAARAQSATVGQSCVRFRGARRCAYWTQSTLTSQPLTAFAAVSVRVFNGDDPEVRLVLFQRLTKSGWVTKARRSGDGIRSGRADDSVGWRECADLPSGTYRSRGKVRWTSEGVRYTRWVTGTKVRRNAIC